MTYPDGSVVRIGDRVLLTTPTHWTEGDPDRLMVREGEVVAVRDDAGGPLVYVRFAYPHSQGGYGILDGPPDELVLVSPATPMESASMAQQVISIPITVIVAAPTLTFVANPNKLPQLTRGVAMTSYPLGTPSGGTPPYSWSIDPNTPVAPGLSVDGSGNLVGTPTTDGTFSFNVILKDSTV